MNNVKEFIDETLSSSLTNKEKKDKLLEYDSMMYCYLGTDSLKKERELVKRKSNTIYRAIAQLDPELGRSFSWYID